MRRRRRWLLVLLLGITAVLLWFIFRPRATQAEYGPAVARCPGPDSYGYTCTAGDGFAYIDATTDSELYALDGTVTLPLPFPFTFYGTSYSEVTASSNGNLQFGSDNPAYVNECLDEKPALLMGDMLAPYWSDLDLRFAGFLEYVVVGQAPNRIFVVEWDGVPPYGADLEDTVTFAVQLFEGSNDIVFLYEDVTTAVGSNGRSATVGIQSANQGTALQLGCNQATVGDAGRLHIPHPALPNEALGQTAVINPYQPHLTQLVPRAPVATLQEQVSLYGPTVLPQLQRRWLAERPPRASEWRWLDVTGNGRLELLILWRGGRLHPELTQLALLELDENGRLQPLLDQPLGNRQQSYPALHLHAATDLTGDGLAEFVLYDDVSHYTLLLMGLPTPQLVPLPEQCQQPPTVQDVDENGRLDLLLSACTTPARRASYGWNGQTFAPLP